MVKCYDATGKLTSEPEIKETELLFDYPSLESASKFLHGGLRAKTATQIYLLRRNTCTVDTIPVDAQCLDLIAVGVPGQKSLRLFLGHWNGGWSEDEELNFYNTLADDLTPSKPREPIFISHTMRPASGELDCLEDVRPSYFYPNRITAIHKTNASVCGRCVVRLEFPAESNPAELIALADWNDGFFEIN